MDRRSPPLPYRPPEVPASDASCALANDTALNAVMEWISLYVPTWGTSLALHGAVILLAAFMMWPAQAVPPPPDYTVLVDHPPPVKTQKRHPMARPEEPRGRWKPQEGHFAWKPSDNPVPGISDRKSGEFVAVIGTASDRQLGGLPPGGPGPAIFTPPEQTTVHTVVYVVDRSGSMTDSLEIVKAELKRSISELTEGDEFHVIFYSSGPPAEMPTRRLVDATERNKQLAFEFIDGVIAQGGTDPSAALERALAVKPELIYLLTDGEFDRQIVELVKRRNPDGRVMISTIGFLYRTGEQVLQDIAAQNRGQYKFISEQDLAWMAGG